MSATSAPFGMRPVWHPDGLIRPEVLPLSKALAEATPSMLQNQPVALDATGRLATVAAGAANALIGVFCGVEYTDLATGRPVVANQWVNGTLVRDFGNQSARFMFTRDPYIIYEIQADGTVPISALGEQASFSNITAGSTVTGLSAATLDVTSLAATQDQLKIHLLAPYVDNDWGDAFTILQVQIARHQEVAPQAGI